MKAFGLEVTVCPALQSSGVSLLFSKHYSCQLAHAAQITCDMHVNRKQLAKVGRMGIQVTHQASVVMLRNWISKGMLHARPTTGVLKRIRLRLNALPQTLYTCMCKTRHITPHTTQKHN
jgi:hypothetical protein